MTLDRPGRRDKQQAAKDKYRAANAAYRADPEHMAQMRAYGNHVADHELAARLLDDLGVHSDAGEGPVRSAVTAIATARAEEAARWRAKIEALATELDASRWQFDGHEVAELFRAVLDGEA